MTSLHCAWRALGARLDLLWPSWDLFRSENDPSYSIFRGSSENSNQSTGLQGVLKDWMASASSHAILAAMPEILIEDTRNSVCLLQFYMNCCTDIPPGGMRHIMHYYNRKKLYYQQRVWLVTWFSLF